MALPKKNRIVSRIDFNEIYRRGKAVKGSFLFIRTKNNILNFTRFGFIISKKIVQKAVDRNKIKRALSLEASKFIKSKKTVNYDIVVVITKKAEKKVLLSEFVNFLEKLI